MIIKLSSKLKKDKMLKRACLSLYETSNSQGQAKNDPRDKF